MDKSLVSRIAQLSNLKANDEELEDYTSDLKNICKILDVVKNIDAQDIEPMVSPIKVDFKFREDLVEDQDNRAVFEDFALSVIDDYFIVPQFVK